MKVIAKYNKNILLMNDEIKPRFFVLKYNAPIEVGQEILYSGLDSGNVLMSSTNIFEAVIALYKIKYNIDTVLEVMDSVDIENFGIFECTQCGKTYPIEERCTHHYDKYNNVCQNCCEDCKKESDFWDNVDAEVDRIINGDI